ncbi:hypothetical protein NC651_019606 [Populus alba x Populus x berolinensis]|nr:hypothetical protein NC651_019606 [Populus alba x Populus x berolinensis]
MYFVRCVQALLNQNKNQKESPFPYREIEEEGETERQSLQFLPIEMRSIPLGFSVSPTSINNHLNFNLKKQKQQRQQQNQYFFTSSSTKGFLVMNSLSLLSPNQDYAEQVKWLNFILLYLRR